MLLPSSSVHQATGIGRVSERCTTSPGGQVRKDQNGHFVGVGGKVKDPTTNKVHARGTEGFQEDSPV